jgi:dual specificity tyrosine-phosphorylation-regulated kinase 1
VVQALDKKTNKEVAIKIIKSKKPFLMQARTEIELLTLLNSNDKEDQNNIGQCFIYELLHVLLFVHAHIFLSISSYQ